MTDCNGATIGVGDVVEVVKQPNEQWSRDWKPSGTIKEISGRPVLAWVIGDGVRNWFSSKQLRLVRRKEKA